MVRKPFFQPQKKWHQSPLHIESADLSQLSQTQIGEFFEPFQVANYVTGFRADTKASVLCVTTRPDEIRTAIRLLVDQKQHK